MEAVAGTFFLIMHPRFDSFSIIHISGQGPKTFPEGFKGLLPGGYREETEIKSEADYLNYLKRECPEFFEGLERQKEEEIDGVKYRLVTKYGMI